MNNQAPQNHLRTHRKKAGLSQHALARLVGSTNQSSVGRHERSLTLPELRVALGYEVVFKTPISSIFPDLRDSIACEIEWRLSQMEVDLGRRNAKDRAANLVAQQLLWMMERRNSSANEGAERQ
jgi:DNA-binding XRE family transcriptional regulator